MAAFITDPDKNVYQLDATTDIVYVTSGKVTSNPIESETEGAAFQSASDNYVNNPETISFSGILTNKKASGFSDSTLAKDTPSSYLKGLQIIKKNATPVTITFFQSPAVGAANTIAANTIGGVSEQEDILTPLTNCILDSVTVRKQSGPTSAELKVDIKATRVILAEQAQVKSVPVAKAGFEDDASLERKGVSPTKGVENEKLIDTATGLLKAGPRKLGLGV